LRQSLLSANGTQNSMTVTPGADDERVNPKIGNVLGEKDQSAALVRGSPFVRGRLYRSE
jgi:hypothetical protein